MNVCAIIVTRGDVDVMPCFETIPEHWQKLVWVNGDRLESWGPQGYMQDAGVLELGGGGAVFPDLSVYGRYEAIKHTSAELIFVQDDDVIVSDPQAIVDAWLDSREKCSGTTWDPRYLWHASPDEIKGIGRGDHVVCNMPPEFRHDGYRDSALVGFGAAFHRDAPTQAFAKFLWGLPGEEIIDSEFYRRTCDIPFTVLTPRVLVDVPKVNREFAYHESRMWKQPGHSEERAAMLTLARQVRDG